MATTKSVAASSGSSVASKVFNKILPINSPIRLPAPVLNQGGIRIVWAKTVGRFVGRWVPWVGWGLLAKDVYANRENLGDALKEWAGGKDASSNWMRNADGTKKEEYMIMK